MLGHTYKEHDNDIHSPSPLVSKDLRASWAVRQGGRPGRGRGRSSDDRSWHQSGRGRGNNGRTKEYNSEEEDVAEEDMDDDDKNRKHGAVGDSANVILAY